MNKIKLRLQIGHKKDMFFAVSDIITHRDTDDVHIHKVFFNKENCMTYIQKENK